MCSACREGGENLSGSAGKQEKRQAEVRLESVSCRSRGDTRVFTVQTGKSLGMSHGSDFLARKKS